MLSHFHLIPVNACKFSIIFAAYMCMAVQASDLFCSFWYCYFNVYCFQSLFGINISIFFIFFSQGKKIKCSTSQAKHRLFIGNVPRNWTEADMRRVVSEVGPGVESVELLKVVPCQTF